MKDAKGHGSDSKGGYAGATAAVTHQRGVQQVGRTAEDHIAAGGKIPTEAQYKALQDQNQEYLKAWLGGRSVDELTESGKAAVGRLQTELAQSKSNYEKFGSEEHPSALTHSLRKGVRK